MIPPMIPPTTTDIMPLETESGTATHVSCVVDVFEVSGIVAVEAFSVLICVLVVSEDLGVGASGIVVVDENDDDDVMLSCVVSGQEFATSSACAYNYCQS